MQGTRYASDKDTSQLGNIKKERVGFVVWILTTPAKDLPPEVASTWGKINISEASREVRKKLRGQSACGIIDGSSPKTILDLTAFLNNPSGGYFSIPASNAEDANEYAHRLNAIMERSGLLSNVNIEARDLGKNGYDVYLTAEPAGSFTALADWERKALSAKNEEAAKPKERAAAKKAEAASPVVAFKLMHIKRSDGKDAFSEKNATEMREKYTNLEGGEWRFSGPRNAKKMDPKGNAELYKKYGYDPERFEMTEEGGKYVLRLLSKKEMGERDKISYDPLGGDTGGEIDIMLQEAPSKAATTCKNEFRSVVYMPVPKIGADGKQEYGPESKEKPWIHVPQYAGVPVGIFSNDPEENQKRMDAFIGFLSYPNAETDEYGIRIDAANEKEWKTKREWIDPEGKHGKRFYGEYWKYAKERIRIKESDSGDGTYRVIIQDLSRAETGKFEPEEVKLTSKPMRKEEEKAIAARKEGERKGAEVGVPEIVQNPFRASYKASDNAIVRVFGSEEERQNAWDILQGTGSCTFTVSKRPGRKIERDGGEALWGNKPPGNFEDLNVKTKRLEDGSYQVTITGVKKTA